MAGFEKTEKQIQFLPNNKGSKREKLYVWNTDKEVHQNIQERTLNNIKMMEGVSLCCTVLSLIFNIFVKMSRCVSTPAYW